MSLREIIKRINHIGLRSIGIDFDSLNYNMQPDQSYQELASRIKNGTLRSGSQLGIYNAIPNSVEESITDLQKIRNSMTRWGRMQN